MPLSQDIIDLIRDEVGTDQDFVDNDSDITGAADELGSLESIYTDTNRGNGNVLITAAIVWRRRLASYNLRAFDVTKDGSWLARSQRVRYLQQMVNRYEKLVGDRNKPSRNVKALSVAEIEDTYPSYYD